MRSQLNAYSQEEPSFAFLLRLWPTEGDDGKKAWRGKVQNIVYGEAHDFDDWPALINRLVSMLPALEMEQTLTDNEENEPC